MILHFTNHETSISRSKTGWLISAAAALLINLVLLSILPVVNLGPVSLPKNPAAVHPVGFVRLSPPEPLRTDRSDQRQETVPRPQPKTVQPPAAVDLSPDILDKALRPDIQPISVQAALPRLPDIPPARVDYNAAGLDGVFDADELDKPLLAVSRPPPFYPLQARRASVEGWVKVNFLVNTQGRVEDVRIKDAHPPGVFNESVRQAVSSWRFQPGTVLGQPVKARVTTTVRFELEKKP